MSEPEMRYVLLYHSEEEFTDKVGLLPACLGHEVNTDPEAYRWDNRCRSLRHPSFTLQYTISGEGFFENTQGKSFVVRAGDMLILRQPSTQLYRLPEHSKCWEVLFISFFGDDAMRLCNDLTSRFGEIMPIQENGTFMKKFWALFNSGQDDERITSDPYVASTVSYDLIMSFFSELDRNECNEDFTTSSVTINKICSFCRWNYNSRITAADMARMARMSRSHFTRLFKKVKGISPMHFLLRIKMQHAASFLETATQTKEIANRCGFDNQSHFCKAFKRYYGVSTSEYRIMKGYSPNVQNEDQ